MQFFHLLRINMVRGIGEQTTGLLGLREGDRFVNGFPTCHPSFLSMRFREKLRGELISQFLRG
ncbi:MAG: hypothetical protein RLZZ511_1761 [Cyanobacteriota bacterium]